jgi:protein involved in sex pheromone biosynthesis
VKKKFLVPILLIAFVALPVILTGCTDSDADVAARNISKAAEQFEVSRKIVGINGITDKYLWEVTGYCSVETANSGLLGALEVTCKVGKGKFKKLFFGLSNNVTYVVQQIDPINVSTTRYRVIFKPETIIPDIDRP